MSYTAQYLLFDKLTSNLLSSQWFLFIFWKKNRKHNWKTLVSLQRIMTWASVLITLFIYFPCFLSPFVSPIVPLNSSLIPYQPPIIFFVHFSPVLNIPPTSPWSPIFPWPHTTNLSTDFTPPSQIFPPYFHPSACPCPSYLPSSPPPPPPSPFPPLSPRYCIQDSGFGCLQQPD